MGEGFKSEYIKTIGADFASKAITIEDNKVHFQVWDLAGQKMYQHVRSSFYSGCKCGFLVFDLTKPETLEKLDTWVEESIKHSGGFLEIFIVLGNKHDLKDQIKVDDKDVEKFLKHLKEEKGIDACYLVTSALTGENINEAFKLMGKKFLENEGFPREGQNVADAKNSQQKILQKEEFAALPAQPQKQNKAKSKSKDPQILKEIQMNLSLLVEKINHLSEILTGMEERVLILETKMDKTEGFKHDLSEIRKELNQLSMEDIPQGISSNNSLPPRPSKKSKNESLEEKIEVEKKGDLDNMIPIPSTYDLESPSTHKSKESYDDYDKIDRTELESMEIIDEEVNEEEITSMLTLHEKELQKSDQRGSIKETNPVIDKPLQESTEQMTKNSLKPKVDKEKKKEKEKKPNRCPKCGSKLAYIRQYERWYCYRCQIYV